MRLSYRHALLDPRPGADNEAVLESAGVLGIEVTVPDLIAHCSLGNLDPQHGERRWQFAAIDAAWEIPPPPHGTILATVRPDLDAIGAMALLELRTAGAANGRVASRAQLVAKADLARRGPWPGPRALPSPHEVTALGPLAGIGRIVADRTLSLDERVQRMTSWLRTGQCSGLRRAEREAADEARGQAEAVVRLGPSRWIAVVRSKARGATELGYRCAPVVVAENSAFRLGHVPPHRKVTVAQWEPGWVDLERVAGRLTCREPGWGGSPTVIGSPQGVGCRLSLAEVVSVLEEALTGRPS